MVQIYTKLRDLSVDSILDLATGQGQFLQQVCDSFKNYKRALGVDNNSHAVKAASERVIDKRISFCEMDCVNLDLEDDSFDVVSIGNSIHHFQNKELILKEAIRVLKTKGYFIVSEMFHSEDERKSQSTHSGFHHWWGDIDRASGNYHGKTFSYDELKSIVTSLPLSYIEFEQFDGEDEDIFSDEIVEQLTNAFAVYKEKAEKLENSDILIERGEFLLNKLKRDGFSPASRLEFVCRK